MKSFIVLFLFATFLTPIAKANSLAYLVNWVKSKRLSDSATYTFQKKSFRTIPKQLLSSPKFVEFVEQLDVLYENKLDETLRRFKTFDKGGRKEAPFRMDVYPKTEAEIRCWVSLKMFMLKLNALNPIRGAKVLDRNVRKLHFMRVLDQCTGIENFNLDEAIFNNDDRSAWSFGNRRNNNTTPLQDVYYQFIKPDEIELNLETNGAINQVLNNLPTFSQMTSNNFYFQ